MSARHPGIREIVLGKHVKAQHRKVLPVSHFVGLGPAKNMLARMLKEIMHRQKQERWGQKPLIGTTLPCPALVSKFFMNDFTLLITSFYDEAL